MDENRCAASVFGDYGRSYQCSRRASVMEGGRWWCRQHAPSFEQARREASERRYQAKRAVESLRDDVIALRRVENIMAREGHETIYVLIDRLKSQLRDKESAL